MHQPLLGWEGIYVKSIGIYSLFFIKIGLLFKGKKYQGDQVLTETKWQPYYCSFVDFEMSGCLHVISLLSLPKVITNLYSLLGGVLDAL